jgi:hypothetical protein
MRGHALDLWQEHEQIADSIEIFSRALDPVLVNLSHSQNATPHSGHASPPQMSVLQIV